MPVEDRPLARIVARAGIAAGLFALSVSSAGAGNAPSPAASAPAIKVMIISSTPNVCDPQGEKREVIVLRGQFPALDAHGAALIVSETGHPQIAVPYDPTRATVPSFSFSNDPRHTLNVVYDGTQWCSDNGQLTFQLVMGGQISNTYSMRIISDDE
jgi:hypothetical protein